VIPHRVDFGREKEKAGRRRRREMELSRSKEGDEVEWWTEVGKEIDVGGGLCWARIGQGGHCFARIRDLYSHGRLLVVGIRAWHGARSVHYAHF